MARKKWKFTPTELRGFITTLREVEFDVRWIGVADGRMIAGSGKPGEVVSSDNDLDQWIANKKKQCA
jgi:hypothetical protein